MPFAVSKYQDTYTERAKPSKDDPWDRMLWFDTEDEAKGFLQDRAFRAVQAAEKALKLAQGRLAKCRKKFPVRLECGDSPR